MKKYDSNTVKVQFSSAWCMLNFGDLASCIVNGSHTVRSH